MPKRAKRTTLVKPVKGRWLVFVDANIFLDFYRYPGESAKRMLKALERHTGSLIMSDQIRMEFLKNRQTVIAKALKLITTATFPTVPAIAADFPEARACDALDKKAKNAVHTIRQKIKNILQEPQTHDPVYRSVHRFFKSKSPFNLKKKDKRTTGLTRRAFKRFILGSPPRKADDTSIGDAINWEWIIECALNSEGHILIVSRDSDYGAAYESKPILNDWLAHEFKERIGPQRQIELTHRLSAALKKFDETVRKEDIAEETRVISEPTESSTPSELLGFSHVPDFLHRPPSSSFFEPPDDGGPGLIIGGEMNIRPSTLRARGLWK
jgi:PIN domain